MVIRKRVEFAFLVAALLAAALVAWARPQSAREGRGKKAQETAPVLSQLYPGEKTELPIHGWRDIVDPIECDADGDIYVLSAGNFQAVQNSLRGGGGLTITRFKPGSSDLTDFRPDSPAGYARYARLGFYVDPRGTVYTLIEAYKRPWSHDFKRANVPDELVVEYSDDGTVDSVTKLEPPPEFHLQAQAFAVFLDGTFLLTGDLISGTPGLSKNSRPTKPFTWIFSPSGAFEGPVMLPGDVRPPGKNQAKPGGKKTAPRESQRVAALARRAGAKPAHLEWLVSILQGGALGSIDGTVYLYRATDPLRLYAISSGGTVFRKVTIKLPEPGMRPMQASLNGNGQILIQFGGEPSPNSTEPPPMVLTLADLQTGVVVASYKIPAGAGTPACAAPGPGPAFQFLNLSKQGNMQLQTFVPE